MGDLLDRIRRSVLLVSYGGGHAAALAPVARDLIGRGVSVEIMALTTASAYFRSHGFSPFGVADILPYVDGYAEAASFGAKLAANQPVHHAVSYEETSAYLGVGYRALEEELGVEAARASFIQHGRQAFKPVAFFRRFFAAARPAVVAATSAPRSERAAIEAASASGIPTLCLVDLYAAFEIEWCAAPGFADRICVLNQAVAERFRERGVSADRLAITGNPAFDRLAHLSVGEKRTRMRAKLGLEHEDRLVAWISQPEPAIHPFSGAVGDPSLPLKIERELADAFAHDSRVHLTIRLHPSEDRQAAVAGPRIRYGRPGEALDDLLSASDYVVTTSSTVGLEAAMLGIPVVQITSSIFSPDLPLAELGFASAAGNAYEAAQLIRDGSAERRLEHGAPAGHQDSSFCAAPRVSREIMDLLDR